MIAWGIIVFAVIILLPGLLAVRLLRKENLHVFDAFLYAVGLGLIFNIIVGAVSNFAFGMNQPFVFLVYASMLAVLWWLSYAFGKSVSWEWLGWEPLAVPLLLYAVSVALQFQTTLISPNLVGSDIHLEYFVSNMVLDEGYWNPMYLGASLNMCVGLTLLIPAYKLLTGLELMMVFKVISPLVFAVLPLVLYRVFSMQFSKAVSVLAVVFFITMPMFTMDMVQLIRQQQSELFFVMVVLVLLDGNLGFRQKMVLGMLFSVGVVTTHIGLTIGFIGYLLVGSVVAVALARVWRNRVDDAVKPMVARAVLAGLAVVSLGIYVGYYGWVSKGKMATAITIPWVIVDATAKQAVAGLSDIVEDNTNKPDQNSTNESDDVPWGSEDAIRIALEQNKTKSESKSFLSRLPFLDVFKKEPLTQTAIGLDFGKASVLGKGWRILQYLVEICLLVGFFKLLFRPSRRIRIEYMAFAIASVLVLGSMYILYNYGWGLGTPRVWGITLLFLSPMFVVGAEAIGKWVTKMEGKAVLFTLAALVPYVVFNSGIVFEVAKLKPVGYIDVPYSIALSSHRVDIAGVFTKEDVEAMDWVKNNVVGVGKLYGDIHAGSLMVQRIGADMKLGEYQFLHLMKDGDKGYIFLRKWNVKNNMLTVHGGYASRQSYSISDFPVLMDYIESGTVVFDNGARVIRIKE